MAAPIAIAPKTTPELGRLIQPAPVSRFTAAHYGGAKPETVAGILREVERGDFEAFVDLCEYMLETDDHLQSVVETRINGVAGKPWDVVPGKHAPGDEQLAAEFAAFCKESLERVADIERLWSDLLSGTWIGISIAEHRYDREGKYWHSVPEWVHSRDLRFVRDWQLQVRDATHKWQSLQDHPNKFIVHMPRSRSTRPTRAGLARTAAWYWLFKRFAFTSWVDGAEAKGTAPLVGVLPPDAPAEVRRALKDGLENLSSGHVAVFEAGTSIESPDLHFAATAEVWDGLIGVCNAAMSKLALGSTLNVEVGEGGGNRSLGESQSETTIVPRLQQDAKQLAGTVARDWFGALAFYNAPVWGRVPPIPQLVFEVVPETEIRKEIYQYHLAGKLVTRNEVRQQLGLEPLEGPLGSELLDIGALPPGGAAPALSTLTGGEPAALPLAARPSPSRSTGAASSPTSRDSATSPLARALYGR